MIHKTRKIHYLCGQRPCSPQPLLLLKILEEPDIVLCQGYYTTCSGANNVVGLTLFQCLLQHRNRLACHCRTICAITRIERNQAATTLLLRKSYLDTTGSQHFNGSLSHFGKKTIYHTTREVADLYASILYTGLTCYTTRRRRQLSFHPIAQRLCRKSWQAAPACKFDKTTHDRKFAQYAKVTSTNIPAAPCNRKLTYTGKPSEETKDAGMGHRTENKFLDPVQAFCLHCTMTNVENQAWQRYFDGTNSFAGITADTEALWTCSGLKAMQEWSDDKSNSATVDIAEGVAAHLLIGWADVGTGSTTNAAQCIFETGIIAHLTTPIINKNDMHLFVRRRGTSDKSRIARNVLGSGTACKQAQLCHGLGKRADQFIITSHNDMYRRQRGYKTAIPLISEYHHSAAFSNQRIRPTDAHAGVEK